MLAAVLHGPGDLRVEEVDEPKPGPGWVKLRVEVVGICGTDKAFYKGTYRPGRLPLIPGHEISGVVEEVGEGVPDEVLGRRVVSEINVSCGRCWYCRNGMSTHCPYRDVIGITINGGMAEHVVVPYRNVHLADQLEPHQAAFVEPLAAVLEMLVMQPLTPGSRVAVIGIGTIGLLSIQVLRHTSPVLLVAVARPDSPKRELARRLGADEVLSFEEALEYAKRETPEGQGFDYVVEATGSPEGLDMALALVRPRGIIAAKSTHGAPVSFNYTSMVVKEVRIVGSRCGPFRPAMRMLREGFVRVEDMVTSTYPLSRALKAFEASLRRDQVKVHLKP